MVKLIENDEHFILVSLLITVCMQMSFFAIACTLKFDKVTDLAGTTNFAVLTIGVSFNGKLISGCLLDYYGLG